LQRFTTIPIDTGRMQAQQAALDAYLIDGFINRPVNVWEFVVKEIIPLLPVIMRQTSRGLYFQYVDWAATALDAVARLDASTGEIERTTPVASGASGVFNEISIEFSPFATSTRYEKRRVLTAEAGVLSQNTDLDQDSRIIGDYACDVSQRLFGIKPLAIRTSYIWEAATAVRIIRDKANQMALPKRAIGYLGAADLAGLEVGSIVIINDPEISVFNEPAILMDVEIGRGSQAAVNVVLIDNIAQSARILG